jgi:hypothetical protein
VRETSPLETEMGDPGKGTMLQCRTFSGRPEDRSHAFSDPSIAQSFVESG